MATHSDPSAIEIIKLLTGDRTKSLAKESCYIVYLSGAVVPGPIHTRIPESARLVNEPEAPVRLINWIAEVVNMSITDVPEGTAIILNSDSELYGLENQAQSYLRTLARAILFRAQHTGARPYDVIVQAADGFASFKHTEFPELQDYNALA